MELQQSENQPVKRKPGRPRLSDEEKQRRATLRRDRMQVAPASEAVRVGVVQATGRDYVGIANQYASDILTGQIPSCRWVRLACERQSRDLKRAADDPTWPFVWDESKAVEACRFIERLPHVEGKWNEDHIVLQPSQMFLLTCLFGWRKKEDPTLRRFTVVYYELGRKGAKSTLMAGICLYHMLKEDEPGASVVLAATTGSQARIVFDIMRRMILKERWLRAAGLIALKNSIVTEDAVAKPINAKASTQDGLNPSLICLDESHAQDFGLHDVLKSAQGARRNPLILAPTTAGYDLLSVGYAMRTSLTKVLERIFDAEHFFGLIYALEEKDDWRDERVWIKANPMIGIAPSWESVRTYCRDAQITPGMEGEFRVKVCSQWMQSSSAWLSMTDWDACIDEALTLEQFIGQVCWIGADLGQKDDISAVALLFERGREVVAFVHLYLPQGVVQDRARSVPAYTQWLNAGILHVNDGPTIDEAKIEADIRGWCKQFNVAAIRFDQYGSAGIANRLFTDGFPAAILDKNRKNITPPARDLETRVRHRLFRHDGNACLKWMASNAVVTRGVDDSIIPKKESPDSANKIDGIDAVLQANSARLQPREKPQEFQVFVFGGR